MSDIRAIAKAIQETKNKLAKTSIVREAIIRVPILLHEDNTTDSIEKKEIIEPEETNREEPIKEVEDSKQQEIPVKPYCKVQGYRMLLLIPSNVHTSEYEVTIDGQKYISYVVRTPDIRDAKLQDIASID